MHPEVKTDVSTELFLRSLVVSANVFFVTFCRLCCAEIAWSPRPETLGIVESAHEQRHASHPPANSTAA
jgi:hypothetical protein